MKKTMPEKIVEVCDFCERSGFLETCTVCKREFCLVCEGIVMASWGFTRLCRECSKKKDVQAVCEAYAEKLTPIFAEREAVLAKLSRTVPKKENEL